MSTTSINVEKPKISDQDEPSFPWQEADILRPITLRTQREDILTNRLKMNGRTERYCVRSTRELSPEISTAMSAV